MKPELAVKGGTVVSSRSRSRSHVYVTDGQVVEVSDRDLEARSQIDATGLLVLPGMVDTHVHLMDPGETAREDFPTGTAAAAAAGVTTVIEHTHSHPVRSVPDLQDKVAYLKGRANVDFGLAAHVWPDRIGGMADLWAGGIAFFKMFTCTTHGVPGLTGPQLEEALSTMASFDGVVLAHCEDEQLTAEAEARLHAEGRDDNRIVIEWRSREAELTSVEQVCRLAAATGARVNVAHVSSPEVARVIQHTRSTHHVDIGAEACPHYFALREDDVVTEGPFRKFTPPARNRSDRDEQTMWDLVRSGVFSHFSTDHAPSTRSQKAVGIWDAPFGLPGLDTTGPFLIDTALKGELELEDVVRLYSEQPAQSYGLYPRKGHLGVGADADMVLVDPAETWQVSEAEVISKAGWTPYAGRMFSGAIVGCYLRGRHIADRRQPLDERSGRWLRGTGWAAVP